MRLILQHLLSNRSLGVSTNRGTTGESVDCIFMASLTLVFYQYSRLSQKSLSSIISSHICYVHCMDRYSIISQCLDDDNYRFVSEYPGLSLVSLNVFSSYLSLVHVSNFM